MTVRCYVPGCERKTTLTFLRWLDAVLETWSIEFYVCKPHYGIFTAEEGRRR